MQNENNSAELKILLEKKLRKMQKLSAILDDVVQPSQQPEDPSEVPDFVTKHLALRFYACALELSSRAPHCIPNDLDLQLNLVTKRLQDRVADSEKLLERIMTEKAQKTKYRNRLQSQLDEEVMALNIVKGTRGANIVDDSSEIASSSNPQIRILQDKKARLAKLEQLKQKRTNQMSDFLLKHFPITNDSNISMEDDIFATSENPPSQSLAFLIQSLITAHIRNPNQWIDIDESMDPRYVELLLLSTIAVRNPNNPGQLRLEKFSE